MGRVYKYKGYGYDETLQYSGSPNCIVYGEVDFEDDFYMNKVSNFIKGKGLDCNNGGFPVLYFSGDFAPSYEQDVCVEALEEDWHYMDKRCEVYPPSGAGANECKIEFYGTRNYGGEYYLKKLYFCYDNAW